MNNDKFLFTSAFCWDLNAMEILSQWVPDVTENIDTIFRSLFQSPYKFDFDLSDEVDSSFIIDALTNYVKRVFGVDESETYDYSNVNKVFPIDFKIFLKKVACYP